jgi:Ca2+/H+ antiporter, TMEM165/GDT1 family
MDAILPVLVAVLLTEIGGPVQATGNALAVAKRNQTQLFAALAISSLLMLVIGAISGAVIATMIAFDARSLLFGLALALAGLPMLWPRGLVRLFPISSDFFTALLGFGRAQIGDASQFIVFAVAARTGEPLLALIGGFLGIMAMAAPAILLREEWPGRVPLRMIRSVAALILIVAGAIAAIYALRLS